MALFHTGLPIVARICTAKVFDPVDSVVLNMWRGAAQRAPFVIQISVAISGANLGGHPEAPAGN